MSPSRLEYLFNRYISQSASAEEEREFMELVEQDSNKDEIQALLKEVIIETEPTKKPSIDSEEGILQAIIMARPAGKLVTLKKNNNWMRYIAAASIILALGIGSYFAFFQDKEEPVVAENGKPIKDDVLPGGDRAVLTLADGSQIVLDSAAMGSLAMQGGAEVAKIAEGKLVYEASGTSEMVYNTVSTPRGGQYQLTLSDGTKVWLNAASSIRFPTAFQSEERVVEISGEVYFEVASAAAPSSSPEGGGKLRRKVPFLVKSGDIVTEVLGTHFNVNSYEDEGEIRVTLLEGAVNVKRESSVKLLPGQSAFVKTTADEAIQVKNNVDTEAVMAWKNGYFSFKDADIRTVMRQLSRWYDIEVVFSGAVPKQQFNGEIGRKLTLKEVLEGLAFTSQHFKIEDGKKLIILP